MYGNTNQNMGWIIQQQQLKKQLEEQQKLVKEYKKAMKGPQYDTKMGLLTTGGGVNKYGIARPGFLTLRGKDGQLDERFQQSMGESFSTLKEKAMTEGDTQAATLARQQQEIMRQADVDRLRNMQATGVSQGMRNLAMRGGVGTGSRERLMRDATRTGLRGFQNIGRENRLANLQISTQDEMMKNELLQKTGMAEQTIADANINLLAQDIQNQNLATQAAYKEDMAAYGAKQTAKAQRRSSGGCFSGETEVRMASGEMRPIKFIDIGHELYEGGIVTGFMKFYSDDLYDYKGVKVTGHHAVKEDGKWIRVEDSPSAEKLDERSLVFNLNCENHIMVINDMIFADYDETDYGSNISDKHSLEVLNGRDVKTILS